MNDNHLIYIMLSDTGSVFTRTIKQYTRAPYNHSSLALDKELLDLYSFGRKNPKNPLNGGFIKEDVLNGLYKYYPKTTCAIYELSIDESALKKIHRLLERFKKLEKKYSYNLVGLLGVVFKEPIEPEGAYFCSQFVADLLKRAGVSLWEKSPSLVQPEDFRKSHQLRLIYEGPLYEYPPVKKRKEES